MHTSQHKHQARAVRATLLATGLLLAAGAAKAATELTGTIIHVEDGDTVTLMVSPQHKVRIRLADIDAPETCHRQHDSQCTRKPGQPFGEKARQALGALLYRQAVTASCRGKVNPGRDDREVCHLRTAAVSDVNLHMVRSGLAWVEPRFAKDPNYYHAQDQARGQRFGLWSMPEPVEPRRWRTLCWKEGHCPQ